MPPGWVTLSVRMPQEMVDDAKARAETLNRPLAWVIRESLALYLGWPPQAIDLRNAPPLP